MRTLKQRLLMVNIITTAAAVLLVIVLMFSAELRTWKEALVRDMAIKADIIGNQCTAALTFNSPTDAEEILGALRADRQIEYAAVYENKGAVFASYRRTTSDYPVPASPPPQGHTFGTGHLILTRPIMLYEDLAGTITIRVGLDQIRMALVQYAAVSSAVLLLALFAASVLLSRLQRSVTEPVSELARLMEGVTRDKDYSRRSKEMGPAELFSLSRSFNEMLTAIQSRDHELERSIIELKDAYGKLEDLDRLKSDFISTVSHELRTPITSIKAFVEILSMKRHLPDERKRRILDTIGAESDRLARLINDLLDLSRIESGVMQWRDRDVVLPDIVRAAVSGIIPLAQKKGVNVETGAEEDMPSIYADGDRLMQVVMNLLSNAIKFTPTGGRISVTTSHQSEPNGVAVSIADTGPGISEEEQVRIFEKFHRSGDILTNTVEGTGLGLAICRQIVEHYGGRIWATSREGGGSTFTFFLPLDRPLAQ